MQTIVLTQGKVTQVDDDLFDELAQWKWYAIKHGKTWYAVRNSPMVNGKREPLIYIHRYIFELMGLPVPKTVDHRDRDGLNNQFNNLRPATRQEQQRNQGQRSTNESGFIGVSWYKRDNNWRANVRVGNVRVGNSKNQHLGYFETALEAALARDEFVNEHRGEFAVLNFPEAFERIAL